MNKTKIWHFIGILLLVCAVVTAQSKRGKPSVTTYQFGQNDEQHIDVNDVELGLEAAKSYYARAFKVESLEEASVLLNQCITLLEHALELRKNLGLPEERAVIHDNLADAFKAAARLFPNDERTARAYLRKATEQFGAILEDCKPVTEQNRAVVAKAAYGMTEILLLLGDAKKAIAVATVAWQNGWKKWDAAVIAHINDVIRMENLTIEQLPPPTQRSTTKSKVLFPLNLVPDMLSEAVGMSFALGGESLGTLKSDKPYRSALVIVAVPAGFVGGLIGGIQEAWRGYPFWNTRSIRMMQGREYPAYSVISEW